MKRSHACSKVVHLGQTSKEHSNHIEIDLGYSYSDFKGGIVTVRGSFKRPALEGGEHEDRWKRKICLRQGSLKVMRG